MYILWKSHFFDYRRKELICLYSSLFGHQIMLQKAPVKLLYTVVVPVRTHEGSTEEPRMATVIKGSNKKKMPYLNHHKPERKKC